MQWMTVFWSILKQKFSVSNRKKKEILKLMLQYYNIVEFYDDQLYTPFKKTWKSLLIELTMNLAWGARILS